MYLPTHSPTQTHTLTHIQNDCQKIPTPCLTKMFLSNTCYLFDLFPCICESAESCLIDPVDESLHVCLFFFIWIWQTWYIFKHLRSQKPGEQFFTHNTFDINCVGFFPYISEFFNSPDINCVSYNSVLALTARVSRQVKSLIPAKLPPLQTPILNPRPTIVLMVRLFPETPFSSSIIC